MTIKNPFLLRGGRIDDPRHFFGRVDEVESIVERLATMGSLSLVGTRQIGKSSLLFYVARQGWQEQPTEYRPSDADEWSQILKSLDLHYLDISLVQGVEDFCEEVLDKLKKPGRTIQDLHRALTDRKVVLFLDEFEKTAGNPNFPAEFFEAMRGLAQTGRLALITATQRSLIDLIATGAIRTSPFYNIFTQLELGPLTKAEARTLLQGTAALAETQFDNRIVDFALDLTDGNPYQLQLMGRLLFDAQRNGEVDLDKIENQFWEKLNPPSPVTVAQAKPVTPSRPLLTVAGLFLVVAGLVGVFAALSGSLTVGYVSIGLILVAIILGGISLLNAPASGGS